MNLINLVVKRKGFFFNNELDYTFSNVANKTKIKNDKWKNVLRGIIHAIGPTGSDSEYDFSQKLKLVVQNLKKVLDEEFDKNENYSDDKQINLRIPLISSAQFSHPSYKNDKGPNEKYFYVYIRELEQVFGCYNIPYLKSVRIYFFEYSEYHNYKIYINTYSNPFEYYQVKKNIKRKCKLSEDVISYKIEPQNTLIILSKSDDDNKDLGTLITTDRLKKKSVYYDRACQKEDGTNDLDYNKTIIYEHDKINAKYKNKITNVGDHIIIYDSSTTLENISTDDSYTIEKILKDLNKQNIDLVKDDGKNINEATVNEIILKKISSDNYKIQVKLKNGDDVFTIDLKEKGYYESEDETYIVIPRHCTNIILYLQLAYRDNKVSKKHLHRINKSDQISFDPNAKNVDDEKINFNFKGTSIHIGNTLNSGHYTAFVNRDKEHDSKNYYYIDDNNSKSVDTNYLKEEIYKNITNATAYVFIYERDYSDYSIQLLPMVEQLESNEYTKKGVGFNQHGNTCFLASLLQLLLSSKHVIFQSIDNKNDKPVYKHIKSIIDNYDNQEKTKKSVGNLIKILVEEDQRGKQQDSAEYLEKLINGMYDLSPNAPMTRSDSDNANEHERSLNLTDGSGSRSRTIRSLFSSLGNDLGTIESKKNFFTRDLIMRLQIK